MGKWILKIKRFVYLFIVNVELFLTRKEFPAFFYKQIKKSVLNDIKKLIAIPQSKLNKNDEQLFLDYYYIGVLYFVHHNYLYDLNQKILSIYLNE